MANVTADKIEVLQSFIFEGYPAPVSAVAPNSHSGKEGFCDVESDSDADEIFPPAIECLFVDE